MKSIETIVKEREQKFNKTKSFVESSLEVEPEISPYVTESVLIAVENFELTFVQKIKIIFRHLNPFFQKLFKWAGTGVLLTAIAVGIYFGFMVIRAYNQTQYPYTVEISKNLRIPIRESSSCLTEDLCTDKNLRDSVNEELNEIKEGEIISIKNGKGQIWEITRTAHRFVIVVKKL